MQNLMKIPYLSTVWATGSFDYNQHTKHSGRDIRKLIGVNEDMRRKRCSVSSPFYMEKTVELTFDDMSETDFVIFKLESKNGIISQIFMLTENGDFYTPYGDDLVQRIMKMEHNPVFGKLQTVVDAGKNGKNLCENHPAQNSVPVIPGQQFPSIIDHIAGVQDLCAGSIIIDDEDGKPEALQKCLDNFCFYNNLFWKKSGEPLLLKLELHEPASEKSRPSSKEEICLLESNSARLRRINHRMHISHMGFVDAKPSIFSVWNADESDLRITVKSGNQDFLDKEDNRDLLNMYMEMKQKNHTEPNPLQKNITPGYRR